MISINRYLRLINLVGKKILIDGTDEWLLK